jgi:hypothetical protein
MAEQEEKSAPIPWLPLITLIGAGSGFLLLFPQLTSSRPGGGDSRLAGNTFDHQTIDARLWQDPLGVAISDREKNEKRGEEAKQKNSAAHSVVEFQKLLIKKCFADSANYPLVRPIIYPLDDELRLEDQASQVQVLAVMIPGGPYVEDVERRLRSRRAVIEALGVADYNPEKDHEVGYFYVPWQPLEPNAASCVRMLEQSRIQEESSPSAMDSRIRPIRSNLRVSDTYRLLVPYEWCEPAEIGAHKNRVAHLLVLWLTDDSFRDAPLARLADLISWFRLKPFSAPQLDLPPLPAFTVLGPDNSGTLHTMVAEAGENPWNNETRQCLATTHIYSSQAAVAGSRLLSDLPVKEGPPIPFEPDCKNLIEQNVRQQQSNNGFCFDRTLLPDDLIVKTLWQELARRGIEENDHIAIISEKDTYCARALCSTFTGLRPQFFRASHLHSYTYLRGIDGKLPSDGKEEKEANGTAENGDKNTQSSLQPTEGTEGPNQADDIRRLATELHKLDTEIRRNGDSRATEIPRNGDSRASLKAVGLLGSDVYDKLELLKALRPVLPEAVFFTNNLDARLAHPDEWKETHNLVVVSGFRLSPERYENVPENIPPFRDSGQTALFAATLEAIGKRKIRAQDPAKPLSPFVFEIGRNEPKELSIPVDERLAGAELFDSLLHIFLFIAIGALLLAWTLFISRMTLATPKEDTETEELIGNEDPDGRNPAEAN